MTTKVAATSATTKPPQSTLAEGEVREYIYNTVNDLGEGQVPINPSVELRLLKDPETVIEEGAVLDTVAIEGTRIYIRVANIEKKKAYLLTIAFDHEPPRVVGEHTIRYHVIDGV